MLSLNDKIISCHDPSWGTHGWIPTAVSIDYYPSEHRFYGLINRAGDDADMLCVEVPTQLHPDRIDQGCYGDLIQLAHMQSVVDSYKIGGENAQAKLLAGLEDILPGDIIPITEVMIRTAWLHRARDVRLLYLEDKYNWLWKPNVFYPESHPLYRHLISGRPIDEKQLRRLTTRMREGYSYLFELRRK